MSNFFKDLFTSNKQLGTEQLIRKKTIVSFTVFIAAGASACMAWLWLKHQPLDHGLTGGVQEPVRKVLDFNEFLFKKAFRHDHAVITYPKSAAVKKARVNGGAGLESKLDSAGWRLQVIKAQGDTLKLTLDDIKKLPKKELTYEFKCIEGWSEITYWGGVRFSDFIKAYGLTAETAKNYIGLVTPDGEYYVGIDMPSAMHPQTLLCYELNGKPLPLNQGYPLRLIIPVKYGVKSLKRIGTLTFSDERPPDYWAERGYDYYIGL